MRRKNYTTMSPTMTTTVTFPIRRLLHLRWDDLAPTDGVTTLSWSGLTFTKAGQAFVVTIENVRLQEDGASVLNLPHELVLMQRPSPLGPRR